MARRKRHFGTVYEDLRSDGSSRGFACRWTDQDGRRRHRRGFPSHGAAEEFVLERHAEVRAARSMRRGHSPDGRLPLRALAPRVLAEWRRHLRPVTYRSRVIQVRQWGEVLGDTPVELLTTRHVQVAVNLMLTPLGPGEPPAAPGVPRGLAPSSVDLMVLVLSGVFRILRATGVGVGNPVGPKSGLMLPEVQQRGRKVLTPEELEAFVQASARAIEEYDAGRVGRRSAAALGPLRARGRDHLRAAIARKYVLPVLANTGIRPEELRRLQWSWIAGDYGGFELGVTKTHDTRVVPLVEASARALRDLRRELEAAGLKPRPEDPVFPIGYTMVNDLVKAAGRLAGLGHITPYALRHSFGTGLLRKGVQIEDIAVVMGHADIKTTHRYTRWAADGALGRVRKALGAGAGGREEGAAHAPPPAGAAGEPKAAT